LAIDHWRRTGEPTSVRIFRALSASESIGSEWLEDNGFGMDYGAGKSTG
jgi:hypothetical protein